MRNATKTAVVAVSAIAAVLAVAIAAYAGAGTLRGTLTASPSGSGHYGDELTISPSMNTTGYPGDTVDLQYLAADNTWQKYGESLSLEETTDPNPVTGLTTIGPLQFVLDGSLDYPAVVRAVFVPKASAEGTCASDPIWIRAYKNARTSTFVSGPSVVKANVNAEYLGTVAPVSGAGKMRVTVQRLPSGAKQTYTVETDESGIAAFNFKHGLKGRYRIWMKFLGNQFGAASSTGVKTLTVK
jgi:hypothetical protein